MNVKRINFIPHLDNYITENKLDIHNKARYIKSILNKKGKHYKNYNQYLIDKNIELHFKDLETFNQYKFTEYSIKNTHANYYKYPYNLKSLEEEYDDFELLDYKTLAFKHFKMMINFNIIKWSLYVANNNERNSHILLYHAKYIFDNMDENIIDKILFNNTDIKQGIHNEVGSIYSEFLDKMNIENKDIYLKEQFVNYNFNNKSIKSQKRLCLNFIKKKYIVDNDIYRHQPLHADTYCQLPTSFCQEFFEWMLFMKINNNNNNNLKIRDAIHKEIIDINIIKKQVQNKKSNIKMKKQSAKSSYKHWISRVEKIEKVEMPRYSKYGNNKKYDYCQERLIYYKNKISEYNK